MLNVSMSKFSHNGLDGKFDVLVLALSGLNGGYSDLTSLGDFIRTFLPGYNVVVLNGTGNSVNIAVSNSITKNISVDDERKVVETLNKIL